MARSRLAERSWVRKEGREADLSTRGVVAVDEERKRVERDVLGEREYEGKPSRTSIHAPAQRVVGETEGGSVRGVEREAGETPAGAASDRLSEERDVGVVAAEEALIERLQQTPGRRGDRSGGG